MEESDEEVVNVLSAEKRVKLQEVKCLLRGGELGAEGLRSDSDLGPTGETFPG